MELPSATSIVVQYSGRDSEAAEFKSRRGKRLVRGHGRRLAAVFAGEGGGWFASRNLPRTNRWAI